jgi:hypothetical protein
MATELTIYGDSLVITLGTDWPSGDSVVEKFETEYDPRGWANSTITAVLKEDTGGALQTLVGGIETLLADATQGRQTVYLSAAVAGEADFWRSRVLSGHLTADPVHLGEWHNTGIRVTIRVRRWAYFEASERELQLSSVANASPATGGITIHNSTDSTPRGNYAQIAAAQLPGVIPAPVRLVLKNTSGSAQGYRTFYLAVNAISDPANITHILEGEAAVFGGGASTVAAGNSGGSYYNYSFTTSGANKWTLPTLTMQRSKGRRFRILARFFDYTSGVYVRPAVADATGLIELESGDEVRLPDSGRKLIDLGDLPMPAGGEFDSWQDHRLNLNLRYNGTANFDVDFIQLTALDSYMQVNQLGNTIANNGEINIDCIGGVVYAGGNAIYSYRGGPLMLIPGRTNRLYILYNLDVTAPVDGSLSVRAYYRPRRLTV